MHADRLERELHHEPRALLEEAGAPERRPERKAPFRGGESRFGRTELEDADGRIGVDERDRKAGVGARRALPRRPHDEPLEGFDGARRRRNEPRDFLRRQQREEGGRIRHAHLAQRDVRAGEDRKRVAPVGRHDRRGGRRRDRRSRSGDVVRTAERELVHYRPPHAMSDASVSETTGCRKPGVMCRHPLVQRHGQKKNRVAPDGYLATDKELRRLPNGATRASPLSYKEP